MIQDKKMNPIRLIIAPGGPLVFEVGKDHCIKKKKGTSGLFFRPRQCTPMRTLFRGAKTCEMGVGGGYAYWLC